MQIVVFAGRSGVVKPSTVRAGTCFSLKPWASGLLLRGDVISSFTTPPSVKMDCCRLVLLAGPADHRRHSALTPAVAHHDYFRTPLSAPVQPSHQTISTRLDYVDLYGNYSVQGPAIIRKVNHALVALVQPGGLISVLSSADADPTLMSCASISHDESETALCTLMGHHLELDGRFLLHDENEGIEHDGRTIVSVDHLSDDNYITLLPGGSVSHPVNVRPRT